MEENNKNNEPLNKDFKVPKLRFPSFKNSWSLIQLSAISNRITRKNKDNKLLIPLTISAKDGLINQYEYFDKQVASKNLSNYYEIYRGEFAYNKSYSNGFPFGTIKRLDYYDVGALSSLYICFSIKNINSDYLVHYFDSNKWNKEIANISGEGARNHGLLNLSANDFFNIKIWIAPSMVEQIKISTLLTLLNKKMDLIEQKISILKKYKDGIAKTLIFEQIKHSKTSVTDICSITTGKLDANACVPNGKYKFFTCSKDDLTINSYAFDCEAILVAGNGEVGFTKYYKGKFNAYQRTYVLTQMKIEPLLVKISIDLQISSVIRKETNKGAMPYIKLGTFKNIKVPNLTDKVQNELNCISNIENMMSNFQQQLKSLEKIKKYLLNSLFI